MAGGAGFFGSAGFARELIRLDLRATSGTGAGGGDGAAWGGEGGGGDGAAAGDGATSE